MKPSKMFLTLLGLFSGLCATGPMTAVMLALYRWLPSWEKYPLPPRLITEKLAPHLPACENLRPEHRTLLTWLAHFGYGGTAGVLYAHAKLPIRPALRGPLFGLAVWLGSYFGLLPALGILSSAEKHPARRNLLMLVAHLVWGWAMALLFEKLAAQNDHPALSSNKKY